MEGTPGWGLLSSLTRESPSAFELRFFFPFIFLSLCFEMCYPNIREMRRGATTDSGLRVTGLLLCCFSHLGVSCVWPHRRGSDHSCRQTSISESCKMFLQIRIFFFFFFNLSKFKRRAKPPCKPWDCMGRVICGSQPGGPEVAKQGTKYASFFSSVSPCEFL